MSSRQFKTKKYNFHHWTLNQSRIISNLKITNCLKNILKWFKHPVICKSVSTSLKPHLEILGLGPIFCSRPAPPCVFVQPTPCWDIMKSLDTNRQQEVVHGQGGVLSPAPHSALDDNEVQQQHQGVCDAGHRLWRCDMNSDTLRIGNMSTHTCWGTGAAWINRW